MGDHRFASRILVALHGGHVTEEEARVALVVDELIGRSQRTA
jgi:hypothetical protein